MFWYIAGGIILLALGYMAWKGHKPGASTTDTTEAALGHERRDSSWREDMEGTELSADYVDPNVSQSWHMWPRG